MLLFLALMVFLLFAGLGFFAHVMWLGLIASFLLLVGHMVRHGLARGTPTSRLNVRLIAALRGFLDDVLTTKARERELREQLDTVPELDAAPPKAADESDEVTDAEIVEDDEVPARTAAATTTRRPEVRASVKERAAHWRAMTPAKLARAEQMSGEGASNAEIARKLGVSRSTISRHLSGKV